MKAFCDSLASYIPAGIKVYYVAAHNHQLASTIDGTKFISGGGGEVTTIVELMQFGIIVITKTMDFLRLQSIATTVM